MGKGKLTQVSNGNTYTLLLQLLAKHFHSFNFKNHVMQEMPLFLTPFSSQYFWLYPNYGMLYISAQIPFLSL